MQHKNPASAHPTNPLPKASSSVPGPNPAANSTGAWAAETHRVAVQFGTLDSESTPVSPPRHANPLAPAPPTVTAAPSVPSDHHTFLYTGPPSQPNPSYPAGAAAPFPTSEIQYTVPPAGAPRGSLHPASGGYARPAPRTHPAAQQQAAAFGGPAPAGTPYAPMTGAPQAKPDAKIHSAYAPQMNAYGQVDPYYMGSQVAPPQGMMYLAALTHPQAQVHPAAAPVPPQPAMVAPRQPYGAAAGNPAAPPRSKKVLEIRDPNTNQVQNQEYIDAVTKGEDGGSASGSSKTEAAPGTESKEKSTEESVNAEAVAKPSGESAKSNAPEESANSKEPSQEQTCETAPTPDEKLDAAQTLPAPVPKESSTQEASAKPDSQEESEPPPGRTSEGDVQDANGPAPSDSNPKASEAKIEQAAPPDEQNVASPATLTEEAPVENKSVPNETISEKESVESPIQPTDESPGPADRPPSRIPEEGARKVYDVDWLISMKPYFEEYQASIATSMVGRNKPQGEARGGRASGLSRDRAPPAGGGPGMAHGGYFGIAGVGGKDLKSMRDKPAPPPPTRTRSGGSRGGVMRDDPRGSMVLGPPPPPYVEPLQQSENAWGRKKEVDDENTIKIKAVRSILNKLTFEKFDTLYAQIIAVGIEDHDVLVGIVVEIFEKAVLEPTYSSMYADLCKRLSEDTAKVFAKAEDDASKPNTFRSILLKQCKEEFQRSSANENIEEFKKRLVAEKGNMTDDQIDEQLGKAKRRMLGNIKFIGQLFLTGLILRKILRNECVVRLLRLAEEKKEDDVIESLCKLISTVGERLEGQVKDAMGMEEVFYRLARLGQDKSLPSRIRFMIQDTLDLKANNYVGRRKEAEAKKIKEVHADIAKADAAKAQAAADARNPRLSSRGDRGRSMAPTPKMVMYDGGAPRSGGSRTDALIDRYQNRLGGNGASAMSSRSSDVRLGPQSKVPSAWGSRGLKPESRKSLPSARPVDVQPVRPAQPAKPEMSQTKLTNKVRGMFDEYASLKDLESAMEDVKDFDGIYARFVEGALQYGMEGKPETHEHVASIIVEAAKRSLVSATEMRQGFEIVIKGLDDIDAPLKGDCVGLCLGRCAADGVLAPTTDATRGLSFLNQAFVDLFDTTTIMKMMVVLFAEMSQRLSDREGDPAKREEIVRSTYKASDIHLRQLAGTCGMNGEEKLFNLLEKYSVSYLVPLLKFERQLKDELVSDKTTVELSAWIQGTLDPSTLTSNDFIRSLCNVILKFTVTGKDTAAKDKERLDSLFSPLVQEFASTEELRLTSLKAVEAFCEKLSFPARGSGEGTEEEPMIVTIFSSLAGGVVDGEVFGRWQESAADTPRNQSSEWISRLVEG